jgi:predicted amidohydrolase
MAARYDLLIKGGPVIDPAQGIDGPRDVALAGGRIAALAERLRWAWKAGSGAFGWVALET